MGLRLDILNNGHSTIQKLALKLIAATSEGQTPGPILTMSYRRNYFGKHLADSFHESMRGGTEWNIGETELFAAFVSKLNQCDY